MFNSESLVRISKTCKFYFIFIIFVLYIFAFTPQQRSRFIKKCYVFLTYDCLNRVSSSTLSPIQSAALKVVHTKAVAQIARVVTLRRLQQNENLVMMVPIRQMGRRLQRLRRTHLPLQVL